VLFQACVEQQCNVLQKNNIGHEQAHSWDDVGLLELISIQVVDDKQML
jgi:hypothetical protein